jgi:5'-nucleotidase (lipoprotein e(P4) family)
MKYGIISSLTFLLFACTTPKKATVAAPASNLVIDGKLWSSAFQQRAAEYKALCLQAYNIARLRVDEMASGQPAKPWAIVTDIDETFLDNSPYAVHQALAGKDYEAQTWAEWTRKGNADTIPGALGFFRYAQSKNIEIYYITNRDENDRAGTLANLRHFNFPFADNEHLLVRETTSGKEPRRRKVAASHEIMLLLGDNLSDFSDLFDKKTEAERDRHVRELAAEFGRRFIVLPNSNYGGWEDAIYENRRDWTPMQKDSLIKTKLKRY